jgi:hypothetical protein
MKHRSIIIIFLISSMSLFFIPNINSTPNRANGEIHFKFGTYYAGSITSLDPHADGHLQLYEYTDQIVETLFVYDYFTESHEPVPMLAQNYSWINATSILIELKEGIINK